MSVVSLEIPMTFHSCVEIGDKHIGLVNCGNVKNVKSVVQDTLLTSTQGKLYLHALPMYAYYVT